MDFDETKWPLVIATLPRMFGIESIRTLCDGFEGYFRRNQRYAVIFDTRPVLKIPDAKSRQVLMDWVHSPRAQLMATRLCAASSLVVASHIARLGLTAVNWVLKPAWPQTHVATMREAVVWTCRKLEDAKVPLGPRLTEFLVSTQRAA